MAVCPGYYIRPGLFRGRVIHRHDLKAEAGIEVADGAEIGIVTRSIGLADVTMGGESGEKGATVRGRFVAALDVAPEETFAVDAVSAADCTERDM